MNEKIPCMLPGEIEKRSFAILTEELGQIAIPPEHEAVVKRVIHTTADFDYARTLCFSPGAVAEGVRALREGAHIVTDTQMARAGVSARTLQGLGGAVHCFMGDEDVAEKAKARGVTRAAVSMEKAAELKFPLILAVGNAPTALIRLSELIEEGEISPRLIIGVPVGFVNVVESKEIIMNTGVPYIVARGRKGGSGVAAAVCNALLYEASGRTL